MSNYDSATDFEINKAVAEALGWEYVKRNGDRVICHKSEKYSFTQSGMDYCNSPDDAWPIIMANNIVTFPKDSKFIGRPFAKDYGGLRITHCETNEGLLRAAMVVYLKLMEAEA